MTRSIVCSALLVGAVFAQSPETLPKFEIADVHAGSNSLTAFARPPVARGGRYEIRNASMLDLIRMAYGLDNDKILGGPNWLELDRFDITAKMPVDAGADAQKQMLQALLEDRFKLQTHKETRSLPTYALMIGKKPQLKEADGSGETGCKIQSAAGGAPEGGPRLMLGNPDGTTTTIAMGPGSTLRYVCRNMTMAAFATGLRGMLGASLGTSPVLDQTELKGTWNFEVKWSLPFLGPNADPAERISIFEALEKQLGLKLEQKPNPTPVLVVDKVNRTPTDNPPGVAEALPTPPAPTEFEVADVKPTNPDAKGPSRFQMQPGGRLIVQGLPLSFLVGRAFPDFSGERLVGLPGFANTERFDITALAPAGAQQLQPLIDNELLAPMMRSLLVDQFKMKYHTEERPVSAYSLEAVKPKMRKADPDSRISCKSAPGSPSSPTTLTMTCQNVSMALFAQRLRGLGPGLTVPVLDATGLEGGWDFALIYDQLQTFNGPGRGGDNNAAPGALPQASDPTGGYTISEALEKQLGLKLQAQKRPMEVIVIDHIEQKPVD
jgi:uncharacterized protein (TIGR03435 family)